MLTPPPILQISDVLLNQNIRKTLLLWLLLSISTFSFNFIFSLSACLPTVMFTYKNIINQWGRPALIWVNSKIIIHVPSWTVFLLADCRVQTLCWACVGGIWQVHPTTTYPIRGLPTLYEAVCWQCSLPSISCRWFIFYNLCPIININNYLLGGAAELTEWWPRLRSLVFVGKVQNGWTYNQISQHLERRYPSVRGLSSASVRRFCKLRGINPNQPISTTDLQTSVFEAVQEVGFMQFIWNTISLYLQCIGWTKLWSKNNDRLS